MTGLARLLNFKYFLRQVVMKKGTDFNPILEKICVQLFMFSRQQHSLTSHSKILGEVNNSNCKIYVGLISKAHE